jgi:uncharacterized protein YndB with AHSA1/START domain
MGKEATAMVQIETERTIPASVARIWEVVASADRLHEWYARAGKVEVLEGTGLGRRQRIGSTWQGQMSEVDQVITAFEPDRLLEWRHESERLGGQPAPRFALETIVRIKLEAEGPDSTRVVIESSQRPADPDKEQAIRGNSEYLMKMFQTSLERLEILVRASD